VKFRILGPLEVVDDSGRQVDLGRPKQRAVLAVLLISANRVVPLERLVDLLWGDDVPSRATGAIQAYISNLRRALEPQRTARGPASVLVTQAPGYRLRVDNGDLDATVFEDLAARGHRDLVDGRPHDAHQLLVDALGMWRGAALAEFATEPFAALEAARLEEARAVAEEDRLAAELAIGRHVKIVGELEVAVAQAPMRERLWELLVLALYRSGRQGEALAAYERARRHLAEELGIDPSPSLRRLEADVLAQAVSLDWRPPADAPRPVGRPEPVVAPAEPPLAGPGLVGRDAELQVLVGALEEARRGHGGMVVVRGEPGIGKTRLAEELAARAVAIGGIVVWGRAYESEGAPPFWPWVQVIRGLLNAVDRDPLVDALGPAASDLAQLVPEVKGIVDDIAPPPALDAAGARFRFFEAATSFFVRLAGPERPLLLVLDDLHWADAPSRQLTVHLASQLPRAAVLVVVTSREQYDGPQPMLSETMGALSRLPAVSWLSLTGLDEEAVERYLADVRGTEPTIEEVEAVRARTEGNPFFLTELVRLVAAEGEATSPGAVPAGVRDVIQRRLARLPDPTTKLLLLAAVAGRDFDLRIAAAAAGMDLDDALDAIEPAVLNGIVVESEDDPGGYRFSHELVRDTIYAGVAGLRRAGLHARIAEALAADPRADAHVSQLAHHYAQAEATLGPDPAFAFAVRAAEVAQRTMAYESAEDHLRRALPLVERMPSGSARDARALEALVALATLLSSTKGIADSGTGEAWAQATELGRRLGDPAVAIRSLWGVFAFALGRADLYRAAEIGDQITRLAEDSDDPSFAAAGHLAVGGVAMLMGRLEYARARLEEGKVLCDAALEAPATDVVYTDLPVNLYGYLAMTLSIAGEGGAARDLSVAMLDRAARLDHPFTLAIALLIEIFRGIVIDDDESLRARIGELLEHAEAHQLFDFLLGAQIAQGVLLAHEGDAEAAVALMAEVTQAMRGAGHNLFAALHLGSLAEGYQRAGRLHEALATVDGALAESAVNGQRFYDAELHRRRGEVLVALERPAAAAESLRQALDVARTQGANLFRTRAETALARLA
jgi:DNA-binding SARP family transcriptional activator